MIAKTIEKTPYVILKLEHVVVDAQAMRIVKSLGLLIPTPSVVMELVELGCADNEVSTKCCAETCISQNWYILEESCYEMNPSQYECKEDADCEGINPYFYCVEGFCNKNPPIKI